MGKQNEKLLPVCWFRPTCPTLAFNQLRIHLTNLKPLSGGGGVELDTVEPELFAVINNLIVSFHKTYIALCEAKPEADLSVVHGRALQGAFI